MKILKIVFLLSLLILKNSELGYSQSKVNTIKGMLILENKQPNVLHNLSDDVMPCGTEYKEEINFVELSNIALNDSVYIEDILKDENDKNIGLMYKVTKVDESVFDNALVYVPKRNTNSEVSNSELVYIVFVEIEYVDNIEENKIYASNPNYYRTQKSLKLFNYLLVSFRDLRKQIIITKYKKINVKYKRINFKQK